jgi:excisionase family DNA binding protein
MTDMDYRSPEWVAKRLGLEKNTVYRYLNEGALPGVQIGRKWLISESHLAQYLQEETRLQTALRQTQPLPAARQVMEQAYAEAERYRHGYLGQEHILLGLVRVSSRAKAALARLGIDEPKVRSLFEKELLPGDRKVTGKPEMRRRADRALCLAAEEALRQGRVSYGAQHILIGLLRSGQGMAFQMLSALGVDLEAAIAAIGQVPPASEENG